MKISFDFDSCIAEDRQQKIAARLIADGHDVWIVTSRFTDEHNQWVNKPVFKVAEKLGIAKEKIVFTQGQKKWLFLEGFDMHFDDEQVEVELIEEYLSDCICVLIHDP